MKKQIASLIATGSLALLLTGQAQAQTQTAPALEVVTPTQNQTIYGNSIPVLVSAQNFEIVDFAQYTTVQRGQGHVHLWLDDTNPTRESAVKLVTENFTYSDVPYGDHTLTAELVNNNHTSLNPPITTTINFKSAPPTTPSPAVAVSGFDKNTALVILVVVALVIIAAWWYTKEETEEPKASETKPKKTTRKKVASKKKK